MCQHLLDVRQADLSGISKDVLWERISAVDIFASSVMMLITDRESERDRQTDRQAGLSHTGRTEDERAYNAVCSQCFISQSLLSCIGQAVGVRGSDRPVCFQTDYQTICFLTSYQTF